jgi:hypothetical protein
MVYSLRNNPSQRKILGAPFVECVCRLIERNAERKNKVQVDRIKVKREKGDINLKEK